VTYTGKQNIKSTQQNCVKIIKTNRTYQPIGSVITLLPYHQPYRNNTVLGQKDDSQNTSSNTGFVYEGDAKNINGGFLPQLEATG